MFTIAAFLEFCADEDPEYEGISEWMHGGSHIDMTVHQEIKVAPVSCTVESGITALTKELCICSQDCLMKISNSNED